MMFRNKEYLRSVVFGIEDSLVSTTGLIAGLSVGSDDKSVVLLGGLVAVFIEATSMGVSEYLSDDAVQDLSKTKRNSEKPLISGILMLVSYLLAGFIPMLPVILLLIDTAVYVSVVLALVGLFTLGYLKGRLLKAPALRSGLRILAIGGLTTGLGLVVGLAFKI